MSVRFLIGFISIMNLTRVKYGVYSFPLQYHFLTRLDFVCLFVILAAAGHSTSASTSSSLRSASRPEHHQIRPDQTQSAELRKHSRCLFSLDIYCNLHTRVDMFRYVRNISRCGWSVQWKTFYLLKSRTVVVAITGSIRNIDMINLY